MGPGDMVALGLATPEQTRPVVRVGADRRYENTGANPGYPIPPGVRAPIVALKPANSGGAKGCRKVDAQGRDRWTHDRRQCHRLNKSDTSRAAGPGRNPRSGPSAC